MLILVVLWKLYNKLSDVFILNISLFSDVFVPPWSELFSVFSVSDVNTSQAG